MPGRPLHFLRRQLGIPRGMEGDPQRDEPRITPLAGAVAVANNAELPTLLLDAGAEVLRSRGVPDPE